MSAGMTIDLGRRPTFLDGRSPVSAPRVLPIAVVVLSIFWAWIHVVSVVTCIHARDVWEPLLRFTGFVPETTSSPQVPMAAAGDSQLCSHAAQMIVKYDIHKGKLMNVHSQETVVDPINRDFIFSMFEDIVKLGEEVSGIGYSLMYARSIQTQLP